MRSQEDRNHIGWRESCWGEIYLQVGNGPAAEKELKAARRRGATEIGVQIQIARAYILQGKFKEVLKELKDEVADNAIRTDILNLRGRAYFGLRMNQDARDSFEEASKLSPNVATPKIGLAKVFVAAGRLEEAEAQIDSALKADPKSVEALVLKGEMSRLKRNPEGALAAFDSAPQS